MALADIQFFGEVDKSGNHIGSDYPAWYFQPQIDELKEEIDSAKRRLERGEVPAEERLNAQEQITKKKERLDEILSSKPKMTAVQKDQIAKTYAELGEKIGAAMYSYDEMERGTADPHKEADRMVLPCIKVDADIAAMCNVKLNTKGEASRDGTTRIWQMFGRLLGESTNPDVLRREHK